MVNFEDIKSAYIKLKSHIYYDTTELFQRKKLAIFETGLLDGEFAFLTKKSRYGENLFLNVKLEDKLKQIVEEINEHHKTNSFDEILNDINLIYLPKNFKKEEDCPNFLTNQRVYADYEVDRVTVFADIPIELHLVCVLWLMKYGYKLDAALSENCVGNRLILNKNKDAIVKGSGLFKPYFSQYQKWRDQSVEEAQSRLKKGSKVAFVNLDIKDYFYSVRLNFEEIEKIIFGVNGYEGGSNIHDIFKEFHYKFTDLIKSKKYPNKLINKIDDNEVVLPIGIASSYILGNYYLNDFDNRIKNLVPQVYYSRYVDDILMVFENPNFDFHKNEKCEDVKFSFSEYLEKETIKGNKISYAKNDKEFYSNVCKTERFVLESLYPIVKLIDLPDELKTKNNDEQSIFKITCYKSAYFQGKKTLLYYFDSEESTTVIDKLKQELEERSSEFRDFPEANDFGDGSFDNHAYHLIFDGSDGKIRTLKDYKENRFGLSVFLANRIFAALKRSKKVDKVERDKLLKFFKGLNNLEHFRLWEKIFTFFLVNDDQEGFVEFYKHTLTEIYKLNRDSKISFSKITQNDVSTSLVHYFDISLEMSLALNPKFIKKGTKAFKDLEIFHNTFKHVVEFWNKIELTKPDSFYVYRFRICNLIRHHYVANPLFNYTLLGGYSEESLVNRSLPKYKKKKEKELFEGENNYKFTIDDEKKDLSPRMVKFWECCLAVTTFDLIDKSDEFFTHNDGRYQHTKILTSSENDEDFILQKAFKLYCEINKNHFTSDEPKIDDFYKRTHNMLTSTNGEKEVEVNEIHIDTKNFFENNPILSIANTKVDVKNIELSIKGKPNLGNERYLTFAKLLKESRRENANILVLPEFSVPYEFVSSLAKYSEKNQITIIAGLEHWNVENVCYNFIVTIIPIKVNGVNDAIVLYRLKNHYAHVEELIIRGFGYIVPKPDPYRYDLINWRNIYFSSYYCFELADTFHRSLFRSKIDLLIASEWNKDTPYFSNIVEALSRDLHCYIAQVNTSQYGDSRLTQPSETARKDLMKLKGGKNNTVLVEELNIKALREFQLKYFERIKADNDSSFKPLPPDWNREFVNKRIDNQNIFNKKKRIF